MRFWRWQRRTRFTRQRQATAIVALVAYLLAATGLPLPGRDVKRDARPFPCQDHACGCSSAEQCWKQCCCYTPRQKLSWARKHGVTPPAVLVAQIAELDDHEAHDEVASNGPGRACCAHRHGQPATVQQSTDHRLCASGQCDHDHDQPDHQSTRSQQHEGSRGIVIGILAQQCRGFSTSWCTCGSVLPPPPAVGWQFCWDTVGWLSLDSPAASSAYLSPLLRPPRA